MDSPIPPDPYEALGVPKDCKSTDIKLAYRKLALRWHPDKITDESAKAKAVEEFHKIQQAYEILSDEERRSRYDAQVRLMELRAERIKLHGGIGGLRVDTRDGSGPPRAYETRTAAPASASPFTPRPPMRSQTFDERKPSYYSDEDLPRYSGSRRHATTDYAYVRRPKDTRDRDSDRDRERERAKEREREDKERRDYERLKADKHRATERDYERSAKEARRREDTDDDLRRRRDRSSQDPPARPSIHREDTNEKIARDIRQAQAHIFGQSARPSTSRTSSSRETQYAYVRPRTVVDPDRRSPPRERPSSSRREAELFEERRPPSFRKSATEPEPLASMIPEKPEVHRSFTTQTDAEQHRRRSSADESTPSLPRSQTAPLGVKSTSATYRPSKLRESATIAGAEKVAATSSSATRKVYQYDISDNGATLRDGKDYVTTIREPLARTDSESRRMSASPLDTRATNKTANMMMGLSPESPSIRTPLSASSRAATFTESSSRSIPLRGSRSPDRDSLRSEDRGRDRRRGEERSSYKPLYREIPSSTTPLRTPTYESRSGASYFPSNVSYAKSYTPDDVKYASHSPRSSRQGSYDEPKPSLGRSNTVVC